MKKTDNKAKTQTERARMPEESGADLPITEEWLLEQEFDAVFDEDGFKRAAELIDDAKRRTPLRLAVAMLARSSADVMGEAAKTPAESADAFLESLESIKQHIVSHKAEIEMMESAIIRLHVLCAKCCALAPDDEEVAGGAVAGDSDRALERSRFVEAFGDNAIDIARQDPDLVIVFDDNSARRFHESESLEALASSFPGSRLIHDCHIVDEVPVGATVQLDTQMHGGIEDRHGATRRYVVTLAAPDHRVSPDSYAALVVLLADSLNMLEDDKLRSMLVEVRERTPCDVYGDVMRTWVDGLCDDAMARSRGDAR